MLESLLTAWHASDLRRKLLFTAAMLAVYGVCSQLPAPAANPSGISIGQNDFLSVL